ncbi:MAG: alanine--tRNA ligase [Elusimicrobia bacterium CG_4_10_14_0_2_um_filter_56_8]|nr:MAG: alanine--tRNA ligase [Elusimicrobia bacterium CG1_02_56_21]PJA13964.1 MAG: alanine--tRNA ligase [Elusimicrobia bacterium CG_4_10_14_0_2_um_filter_56_8]
MQSYEIRKSFLDFFAKNGHPVVKSSPLIPEGDPSLLFTSAGMVQFKPYYLGLKTDMKRAASCQKSFRTTDIDNVGKTIRHLTFFEMLGNFSFGDYFKKESLSWGWEFLTKELGLPAERFYPSIYKGGVAPRDEEARAIWESILPANLRSHIIELGDKDNFWAMGDTGPSGPCSEVYWDRGEKYDHKGCAGPGACECDRYIEIWNHVFTQFDKQAGGTFKPLPRKNIDTGLGLERLTFIVEGKESPFETSLFQPVVQAASKLLKVEPGSSGEAGSAYRIISEHLRASSFLIAEGIMPSNEGRGYVLRRLIRRAARYGRILGAKDPFLHALVPSVHEIFRDVYPEVILAEKQISAALKFEEQGFIETLETGEKFLSDLLEKYPRGVPGKEAFKLYETYGFPIELTRELALKKNIPLDETGFEAARKSAQETARANWKDSGEKDGFIFQTAEEKFPATVFKGYEVTETESEILGLVDLKGNIVDTLPAGADGYAVLDSTPFYAVSGGQVGDTGHLISGGIEVAGVANTQKPVAKVYFHYVKPVSEIKKGMKVLARVSSSRHDIACNHTAVHVVNAALKEVFGDGTRQAGSDVDSQRFRFDYTITKTPNKEELSAVEKIANEAIKKRFRVFKMERPLKDAGNFGATTLLGEKYQDPARFVLINSGGWDAARDRYSLELCGGTHIDSLSELVVIKILKDSSVSRGVRRIEGVAGPAAVTHLSRLAGFAEAAASRLSIPPQDLPARVAQLLENIKELKAGKAKSAPAVPAKDGKKLLVEGIDGSGSSFLVYDAGALGMKDLRGLSDEVKKDLRSTLLFIYSRSESKFSFIITHTGDVKVDASAIAKSVADAVNGSGGGRKDFAQGGGEIPADLKAFEKSLVEIAKKHV